MKRSALFIFLFLNTLIAAAQQKVINLYDGAAPGSEKWTYSEKENTSFGFPAVYNVSHPTLTAYLPNPAIANGTAVIVCPGGGFYILSMRDEGTAIAEWLNKKGVAAFVLKYRLGQSITDNPVQELSDNMKIASFTEKIKPIVPLSVADGKAAIAYVRAHAAEYHLSPGRIGIMGFSAGGTVAAGSAYNYTAADKPDFIAPIYAYVPPYLKTKLAADESPIFLAVATDDQLNLVPASIDLYNDWHAAKHDAELHIYEKGGHGFGLAKHNIPTDTWIERFGDWLNLEGFMKATDPKVAANMEQQEANRKSMEERPRKDWAFIQAYAADNSQMIVVPSTTKTVVYMGDSITAFWKDTDPDFFTGNNYISRGISGQTSGQILLRFREDVINLHPAAVVILCGINDIAENNGPSKLEDVFGNIQSMAQLARAAHIKVVLSSVLPAVDFPWRPGMNPAPKVVQLNRMIKDYADKSGLVYLNYYDALVGANKGMRDGLSKDGVHPTLAGYKIMEPMAKKAIAKAMRKE